MDYISTISERGYPELAVRKQSVELLEQGLIALSVAETNLEKYDYFRLLSLYYNSAKRLNQNPDTFFQECIVKINNSPLANIIKIFISRPPEINTIQAMGYTEIFEPEFTYLETW